MRREFKLAAGPIEALAKRLAPDTPLAALQKIWPDIVGEFIAQMTNPVTLIDGKLTVKCEDSVAAHEFQMMQSEILEKISTSSGQIAVRSIKFVV